MSSQLETLLVNVLIWVHALLNPFEYFQLSRDTRDYHCSWRSRVTSPPQEPHFRSLHIRNRLHFLFKLFIYLISLWCIINLFNVQYLSRTRVRVITFNATVNKISVLLVLETGVPGENIRPAASHWQTKNINKQTKIHVFKSWPTSIYCLVLGLRCLRPLSTIFNYIVAVSFIVGGKRSTRRKPTTCRKSLTNFITYCLYYWVL